MDRISEYKWQHGAMALVGTATLYFAARTIHNTATNYRAAVKAHKIAAQTADPKLLSEWNIRYKYESLIANLRREFTRTGIVPAFGDKDIPIYISPIAPTDFYSSVMFNQARAEMVRQTCADVGVSVEEAFARVFSGDVPWAGQPPIPLVPDLGKTIFDTSLKVFVATFFGGVLGTMLQASSASTNRSH